MREASMQINQRERRIGECGERREREKKVSQAVKMVNGDDQGKEEKEEEAEEERREEG